jgi:hypothetical protein
MKSIKERCIDLLKNEDIRKDVIEIIKPISEIIYNEIYVYIWFICIFVLVLIILFVANLYLLFCLLFSLERSRHPKYYLV